MLTREFYFTTLMTPNGPQVYLFNKYGIVGEGSLEQVLINQYGLRERIMQIAEFGSGQGIVKFSKDGSINIKQVMRSGSLPNIYFPYPRFVRQKSNTTRKVIPNTRAGIV